MIGALCATVALVCSAQTTFTFNGRTFELWDTSMTHDDAITFCATRGFDLASIHSANENDAIRQRVSARGVSTHIGLSDAANEGCWRWSDGTNMTYQNWASQQPDDKNGQDYALMLVSGSWDDAKDEVHPFLCASTATLNGSALVTWSYNDRTFEYYQTCATWAAAEAHCVSRGMHLASTHFPAENAQIQTRLSNAAHIGLTDESSPGTWSWTDSSAFSYTNWGSGEPGGSDSDEHVVQMYVYGSWNDVNNNAMSHYVCATDSNITAPLSTWTAADGRTFSYWPLLRDRSQAQEICWNNDMVLASVHTVAENEAMRSVMFDTSFIAWTGLGDQQREGDFKWDDLSSLTYTNWASGEPNNDGGETWGTMNPTDGRWNDVTSEHTFHFFCSQPSLAASYTYANRTWEYWAARFRWETARDWCNARGLFLASVHHSTTNFWLRSRIAADSHLGLSGGGGDGAGDYSWEDGSKYDYSSWDLDEPNNANNNERFVALRGAGRWFDQDAGARHNWVCASAFNTTEFPLCRTGQYWDSATHTCHRCPRDSYQVDDFHNLTTCIPCGGGKVTIIEGSEVKDACRDGAAPVKDSAIWPLIAVSLLVVATGVVFRLIDGVRRKETVCECIPKVFHGQSMALPLAALTLWMFVILAILIAAHLQTIVYVDDGGVVTFIDNGWEAGLAIAGGFGIAAAGVLFVGPWSLRPENLHLNPRLGKQTPVVAAGLLCLAVIVLSSYIATLPREAYVRTSTEGINRNSVVSWGARTLTFDVCVLLLTLISLLLVAIFFRIVIVDSIIQQYSPDETSGEASAKDPDRKNKQTPIREPPDHVDTTSVQRDSLELTPRRSMGSVQHVSMKPSAPPQDVIAIKVEYGAPEYNVDDDKPE